MAIIYNENMKDNEEYALKQIDKKYILNNNNYTYALSVVKEFIYRSNSIDFNLDSDGSNKEKYIELEIDLVGYMRIFGVVKDSYGNVVSSKKITLFKSVLVNYRTEYISVCEILTDENGKYEVLLYNDNEKKHYKISIE